MKGYFKLLLVFFFLHSSTVLKAQCSDSTALYISYDTTVIGSSNDQYLFTFPKFDPSVGTLIKVELNSVVTLKFAFNLENKENTTITNYRAFLFRTQEISSASLMTPLINTKNFSYGKYTLGAADGNNGAGPDYLAVGPVKPMDHYIFNDEVFNTADFMGSDSVVLDYASNATAYATGSLNNVFTSIAQDTVQFTLRYKYCPAANLANEFTQVLAYRKDDQTYVKWSVENETADRNYLVQRSNSNKGFVTIETIESKPSLNGKYSYSFNSANEKGKAQFRVIAADNKGTSHYSRVVLVEYKTSKQNSDLKLFPNPTTTTVQLLFHPTIRANYAVQVMTPAGQLVKKYQFNNALMARINEQRELPKGMYFVRAMNLASNEMKTVQLVVQ
jgi:hypothetical protein